MAEIVNHRVRVFLVGRCRVCNQRVHLVKHGEMRWVMPRTLRPCDHVKSEMS